MVAAFILFLQSGELQQAINKLRAYGRGSGVCSSAPCAMFGLIGSMTLRLNAAAAWPAASNVLSNVATDASKSPMERS
jgi:hypothetical protein